MKRPKMLCPLALLLIIGCGGDASSSGPPPSEEEMIQQSLKDQQDAVKGKQMPGS